MPIKKTRYLHIIPLSEQHPLLARFTSIAHLPYSLLFDSAGNDTAVNRFSIMAWQPSWVYTLNQKRLIKTFPASHETLFIQGDPTTELDKALQAHIDGIEIAPGSEGLAAHLPFQNGIAGLMNYDAGREYLHIPTEKQAYQTPDLCIGLYPHSIILDHQCAEQYYCCLTDSPDSASVDLSSIPLADEDNPEPKFAIIADWQANMTAAEYAERFEKIQYHLVAGDCYQANFAQRFETSFEGDPFAIYQCLREANHAPFSAFMRLPRSAIISVSPERFLSVKDKHVETKPIKGTRPRSADAKIDSENAADLLSAEKDRAENLMIVDLLRNDLSKHCEPSSVAVPALFELESYAAVHHLVSTVTGKLAQHHTPLQLLQGAFPGGSITGAPKFRAMEIIEDLEPSLRSIYCGSMLYVGWQQDMDSSICIRTLLAEQNKLYCWAGGGIVIDSNCDAEYQESLDKVARILPVLERR